MFYAGIDWSDRTLDFLLLSPDGAVLTQGQVATSPEGLGDLFVALEAHAPAEQIGIAVETKHGAWMQSLLDRGYRVYPVHPKSVDNFRKALLANGDKSDRIDRHVLAKYLATFDAQLRPLRPDHPQIVCLRTACQDRLRLVEERTDKLNELRSILKVHYPAFLPLFGELRSTIALEFLQEFPTQQQMRALSPRRLRGWLRRHHYTRPQRTQQMVALLTAPVLPVPEHLQKAKAALIQFLASSLLALNEEIARREREITEQFHQLPEARWAGSLPGAGANLGPALLACFGRDRSRFQTAADARAFMGTAPVTQASGRSRRVRFRFGCWKFARRTLQLFADQSRHRSAWAQAFYQRQRDSGHRHHQALRALAHKWVKILLAMQRTATPYNELLFTNSQQRYLLRKTA